MTLTNWRYTMTNSTTTTNPIVLTCVLLRNVMRRRVVTESAEYVILQDEVTLRSLGMTTSGKELFAVDAKSLWLALDYQDEGVLKFVRVKQILTTKPTGEATMKELTMTREEAQVEAEISLSTLIPSMSEEELLAVQGQMISNIDSGTWELTSDLQALFDLTYTLCATASEKERIAALLPEGCPINYVHYKCDGQAYVRDMLLIMLDGITYNDGQDDTDYLFNEDICLNVTGEEEMRINEMTLEEMMIAMVDSDTLDEDVAMNIINAMENGCELEGLLISYLDSDMIGLTSAQQLFQFTETEA